MRPSAQLPIVSGADSKLGLTMGYVIKILSVCDTDVAWSYKLCFFENNYMDN